MNAMPISHFSLRNVFGALACRTLMLLGMAFGSCAVQASWVRFGDVYGNADIWYDNKIDNKGSTSEIRTFMIYPVRRQVPLSDPKAINRDKVKLVTARSELSSYEFDCKNQSVQLKYRIFYADVDGKFMLVEHKSNDVFITESNSIFAQQFQKRPVFPNNFEVSKTMAIACKAK
jgi:hypothetical protein